MKRMWARWFVGAAAVCVGAVASGCAVDAQQPGAGTDAHGKIATPSEGSGSVKPEMSTVNLQPCSGVGPTSQYATVLMRLPDWDGCDPSIYPNWSWTGKNYCDGFTIEAPTPWVSSSNEPYVHNYESHYWSNIPTSQAYQYLVQQVTLGTCYSVTGLPQNCFRGLVSTHQWFSSPTTSASDYNAAQTVVSTYGQDPSVGPATLHTCVYYVDPPAGVAYPPPPGTPMTVHEFQYIADIHDPTTNPNGPFKP